MDEKDKTCGNCGSWDSREGVQAQNKRIEGYGMCGAARFTRDFEPEDMDLEALITAKTPMMVEDGEGYWAGLWTRNDHCCKAWMQKEIDPAKAQRR